MAEEETKKALGHAAALKIEEGMCVGLGSGTTVNHFIEALSERIRLGLNIRGCPTSQVTSRLAIQAKIPLVAINRVEKIDIAVDGADQVDQQKRMIKGRGAALLREKIVLSFADKTLILIDEKKKVPKLGDILIPLEVVPIADLWVVKQLEKLGYPSRVRLKESGIPVITDNQNHIVDIDLKGKIGRPEDLETQLKNIPGIVETGLFFNLASEVLVGRGKEVEVWS